MLGIYATTIHRAVQVIPLYIINKRGSFGPPLVFFKSILRASYPAAPGISSLLLLPLGPDRVRRVPPRRTHPEESKDTSGPHHCQCFALRRAVKTTPPIIINTNTLAPITRPAFPPTAGSIRGSGVGMGGSPGNWKKSEPVAA